MASDTPEKRPYEYRRDEHRVYLSGYHLIWIPKRRKPVLTGRLAKDCRARIRQTCADKGWDGLELAVQPDQVYWCVRVWPTESAAGVVRECNVVTAHELRAKYPAVLKKLPSLWTRVLRQRRREGLAGTIDTYTASQRGM